jgi:hypothetical protein
MWEVYVLLHEMYNPINPLFYEPLPIAIGMTCMYGG